MTIYSDRHYGAGDPTCPICGGVGYVRRDVPEDHPQFGKAFDCECRRERVAAERQAYLRRMGGLEHLTNHTLETFIPGGVGLPELYAANLRRVYERVVAYAKEPKGWLVLTGGYGCGKTHLAAAIANAQIDAGNMVMFVTVPDLLDHLRAPFNNPYEAQAEGYNARFEEVRTTPLLILDDLGTESPTPWATEKLYQILNHRYMTRLPTVITTNHDLEELELRLRSRFSDPDLCQILGITAPDYRGRGISIRQSDLNELSLYGHMRFDAFEFRRELPKEESNSLRRVLDVAREFAKKPSGWLILMGPYGCGKTHLAASIANAQAEQGVDVLFITVPNLLDHLRATFAPNSTTTYDKQFGKVKMAPFLVLDDLGTESATPWAREKMYQLFNYRYNAELPTVITTAYPLEDLDQRLVTRMRDKRLSSLELIKAPAYLGERRGQRTG